MKSKFTRLAITGLMCVGLAACGSDDDDDDSNAAGSNGTDQSGAPGNGEDAAGTSQLAPGSMPVDPVSAFDGTWVSNCSQELSTFGISEFQRIELVVNADFLTRTISSFSDSDCSVAAEPAVAVTETSMQFPEGEVTTTQGPAMFVDMTTESIVVDGIDVSAFQQTVGLDTEFNIFVVGLDGRLYFGVPGLSAVDRPTSLNTGVYFEAQ